MRARFVLAAMALLLTGALLATAAPKKPSDLPERWRVWLEEEVYPLISKEERKAFLELETDAQRQEFAERLWSVWSVPVGIGTTAFRRNFEERLEMARGDFGNTTEDRARVLLLHGPPDMRRKIDCESIFYPLDFWYWERIEGLGQKIVVLFYQPYGLGRFRLWNPYESRAVLYTPQGGTAAAQPSTGRFDRPEYRCGDGEEILRLLAMSEYWLKDPNGMSAMQHVRPSGETGKESASTRFLEFSTILPKNAATLSFSVASRVGGRRGSKMSVVFYSAVKPDGLSTTKVGDTDVVQLDVTGELSREGTMVDRFRYAFTFPLGAADFPIVVERELRPGDYHLRVKIADSNSKRAGIQEIDFTVDVPVIEPMSEAERQADATVQTLAGSALPALSLSGPEGEGLTGVQRFTAMTGGGVDRVEFLLDGKPVMSKNRPPFEVELDLGPVPRLASVHAVAYARDGQELDRKQVTVNVGRERFLVRLQPVGAGDRAEGKVRARASVNVPPEKRLDRVELFWNEGKVATLSSQPVDTWLPVTDSAEVGYLRALAVLDDGAEAEDVQFVNVPGFLQDVRVEAVELPVTVLGSGGKPLEGLKRDEFEVTEDGVRQDVSHFSLQQDLPIRLGLVLDTSGSMEKTLPDVQRVVMGFLRNLLRPRDRANIVAFSDRPALLESFTADFGALERAMIALKSDRETALYDAIVYGLFQFSGVRGRKAMIVLTDGEDNASRMDFDRALEYARRSGVVIYTIGIDLPITKVRIRSQLSRLASTTGGQSFYIPRDGSLQPIYDQINRELRTQYLLAYTSTSDGGADTFRKISVKVRRPNVEVRTLAGYYPGG